MVWQVREHTVRLRISYTWQEEVQLLSENDDIKKVGQEERSTYDAAPCGIVKKCVFRCDVVPNEEEEKYQQLEWVQVVEAVQMLLYFIQLYFKILNIYIYIWYSCWVFKILAFEST